MTNGAILFTSRIRLDRSCVNNGLVLASGSRPNKEFARIVGDVDNLRGFEWDTPRLCPGPGFANTGLYWPLVVDRM